MKTMTKPGLEGVTCPGEGAQKESFSKCLSPVTGLAFTYHSGLVGVTITRPGQITGCHWCQLQLAHNKPAPVWGQSLPDAVPAAWATFLPRNSSCSPPTKGAFVDAGTIQLCKLCVQF